MGTIDPNSISRSNPPGDAKETARTKSLISPDSFRKSMDGRDRGKEQEDQSVGKQKEKGLSLFDLSGSKKPAAHAAAIKSADSPTLPEPNTQFASSNQFDRSSPGNSPITSQSGIKAHASAIQQSDLSGQRVAYTEEKSRPSLNISDYSGQTEIVAEAESYRSSGNSSLSTSSEIESSNQHSLEQERRLNDGRDARDYQNRRANEVRETANPLLGQTREERFDKDHSKKDSGKADQTSSARFTSEQQQVRTKKEQTQKSRLNPTTAAAKTDSDAQTGKMKKPEKSLIDTSLEDISVENNLKGFSETALKNPTKGDDIFNLQKDGGQEGLSLGVDGTLISQNDEFSAQSARLDSSEKQISETIVGGTIQKNLKSDIIAKKEMMEIDEKLAAGLNEATSETQGTGTHRDQDKSKSQLGETRHIDIEAVPSIQSAPLQAGIADTQQPNLPSTVDEIYTLIMNQVQTLTTKDEIRTTVTLNNKNSPFDGATITLTASKDAQNEFNISIANLKPDAKKLLDFHLQNNSLVDHLSEKGITVHMVQTSTQAESFVIYDDKAYQDKREPQAHSNERSREQEDGGGQGKQQGRQQGKQRNQKNEEEEPE